MLSFYMQNKDDFIELIQPTPKLHTRKCKILAKSIAIALFILPFIVTIILWYKFDLFVGLIGFAVFFLITGIVRSKLRILSIPPHQLEYDYTDLAIATWYAAKYLCYEEIDAKNSKKTPV